jgi:hypothetical protein
LKLTILHTKESIFRKIDKMMEVAHYQQHQQQQHEANNQDAAQDQDMEVRSST